MNKKTFFVFFAALTVLMGCNATNKKEPATPFIWTSVQNPNNDQSEKEDATQEQSSKKEVTAKAEASTETTTPAPAPVLVAEAKQPEPAKPAPAPAPAPAPEPFTRSIPVEPYGTPGVILRNAQTVTYRPAYAGYNAGFMFRMQNDSTKLMWVAPASNVSMRPLVGQCMESPRLPLVPNPEACPFIELKTNTGSWVVLIKPGYSAQFVVDTATCPPDGSACKARIQSVPHSMSAVTRPDLSRKVIRTFDFPSPRSGLFWARGD